MRRILPFSPRPSLLLLFGFFFIKSGQPSHVDGWPSQSDGRGPERGRAPEGTRRLPRFANQRTHLESSACCQAVDNPTCLCLDWLEALNRPRPSRPCRRPARRSGLARSRRRRSCWRRRGTSRSRRRDPDLPPPDFSGGWSQRSGRALWPSQFWRLGGVLLECISALDWDP